MPVPSLPEQRPPAFHDRREAGAALGKALARSCPDFPAGGLVLALPRGGVPVASEVAGRLQLPLDVLVVRKLGAPGHEELAMGAIAEDVCIFNGPVIQELGISQKEVEATILSEKRELQRRLVGYRAGRPPLTVAGRTVLLIDDGIATGSTVLAAIAALRKMGAGQVIVATPVCPAEVAANLSSEADRVVALYTPEPFGAVGRHYANFDQTTDGEVRSLLDR